MSEAPKAGPRTAEDAYVEELYGAAGTSRLLDGAHGEAADETVDEEIVKDGDGQAGDEAGAHERAPEVNVTAN